MRFLPEKKETLIHLFWDCKNSQTFWKALETWLYSHKILDRLKNISKLSAIGLNTEPELPLLSLCTRKPELEMFLKLLEHHALMEKQTMSIDQYEQKWQLILRRLTANPTYSD